MAAISADKTFKYISCMKVFAFLSKSHLSLFVRVQLPIYIGLDNGLASNRRQAIIWTNYDLDYWRIYASNGFNNLLKAMRCPLTKGAYT